MEDKSFAQKKSDLEELFNQLHECWQDLKYQQGLDQALQYYIPVQLGYSPFGEKPELGLTAIQRFIDDVQAKVLLLAGDSGCGKTFFGQWLTDHFWAQRVKNESVLIPLFISLPSLKYLDSDTIIRFLNKTIKITESDILKLNENCQFLFILDAYDELSDEEKGKNLFKITKLHYWKVKVIISCRTEFLARYTPQEQVQLFAYCDIHRNCQIETLQTMFMQVFGPDQWLIYTEQYVKLQNDYHYLTANDYLDKIKQLPGIKEMIQNPFVLRIVLDHLPQLWNRYQEKQPLDRPYLTRLDIYQVFVKAWFNRQKKKLLDNGQIKSTWDIEKDYELFSQQLANLMWQENITEVIYDYHHNKQNLFTNLPNSLSTEVERQLNIWQVFFEPNGYFNDDKDKPLALVRQGCPLQVIGNQFRFMHDSLREYFAAQRLFKSVATKASLGLGLEINVRLIRDEYQTLRFLAEHVNTNPDLEQTLWDLLEESKHESRVQIAAANAVSILNAAGKSFNGKDLSHVRFSGANLNGAILQDVKFNNADLREVNFSNVLMSQIELNAALLDHSILGEKVGFTLDQDISICVMSNDGKFCAVASGSKCYLFDWPNLTLYKYQPNSLTEEITCLIFGKNSDCIIVGDKSGYITVWKCMNGSQVAKWRAHKGHITSIAMSHKQQWLISAAGHNDHTVKQWNIENQSLIKTFGDNLKFINALAISPDDQSLVTGSNDSQVKSLNLRSGQCVNSYVGHKGSIKTLAIANHGKWFVTGDDKGIIKRWDVNSDRCLVTYTVNGQVGIQWIVINSANQWFIVGCEDNTVKRWYIHHEIPQDINVLWGRSSKVYQPGIWDKSLCLSYDDQWLIYGEGVLENGQLRCTNIDDSKNTFLVKSKNKLGCMTQSQTKPLLLVGFAYEENSCIEMWDIKQNKLINEYLRHKGRRGAVGALRFDTDSQCFIAVYCDAMVVKWSSSSNTSLATYQVENREELAIIAIGGDLQWFLSVSKNTGTINRWNIFTGKLMQVYSGHVREVYKLVISDDNCWFLSASEDLTTKCWDIASGKCLNTFTGHRSLVFGLCLTRDNKWLITGAGNPDQSIKRWDTKSGQCVMSYIGHENAVTSVTLSPDEKYVMSGSFDNVIRCWYLDSGKCIQVITLCEPAWSFAWKESVLIIGSLMGTIYQLHWDNMQKKLNLKWRSKANGLQVHQVQAAGIAGLNQSELNLLKHRGAHVFLSTKSSDDIIKSRNQNLEYDQNNPPKNLFGGNISLSPKQWVVTLVRKKGERTKHAFLVLECIDTLSEADTVYYYRILQMDFYIEQRQTLKNEVINNTRNRNNLFGQAHIEITNKSYEDMKQLAKQSVYLPAQSISPELGNQLLKNVRNDQLKRINYCLMGDSVLYQIFRVDIITEQHSCISWCEKQLENIGICISEKTWLDKIVVYTPAKIPEERTLQSDADPITKSSCNIM